MIPDELKRLSLAEGNDYLRMIDSMLVFCAVELGLGRDLDGRIEIHQSRCAFWCYGAVPRERWFDSIFA
jgi:hypothetical protein